MTLTVVKTLLTAAHEDAIRILEERLKEARAGQLTGLAVAWTSRDGTTGTTWSSNLDCAQLTGSVARLQYRMLKKQDEESS